MALYVTEGHAGQAQGQGQPPRKICRPGPGSGAASQRDMPARPRVRGSLPEGHAGWPRDCHGGTHQSNPGAPGQRSRDSEGFLGLEWWGCGCWEMELRGADPLWIYLPPPRQGAPRMEPQLLHIRVILAHHGARRCW